MTVVAAKARAAVAAAVAAAKERSLWRRGAAERTYR